MNVVKKRDNQVLITAFWDRVNTLIKKCNTTKLELSKALNPEDPSPRKLQNMYGKRLPDAEEVVIIARALNTTVEYLVTGETGIGLSESALKAASIFEGLHKAMKPKAMEMLEFFDSFKNPISISPDDIPEDYHPTV